MIVDSIKGMERYLHMHPGFGKVFEFIRKKEFPALEPGEYEIDGRNIYCTIWQGKGKGLEELPKLEVHDSYIDIHVVLEGTETIGLRDRGKCNGDNLPYDENKDIAFLEEEPENFLSLGAGNIAVIFPHDAHAPLISEGTIKKAVLKIRL